MSRSQLIGGIAFAIAVLFMSSDTVLAQRGGQRGGPRGGGGDDGMLRLLSDEQVQEELEILDEQKEDLEAVGEEARDIYRGAFSGMREKMQGLDRDEQQALMAEIRDEIQDKVKGVTKKIEDILVPHQLERLQQIAFQTQMRRGGTSSLADSDTFREQVGLTDEEAKKLKEKEEEVRKKIEEKIKKIREEGQDEVLSVLSQEKQDKIKSLIGETFEMQDRRGGRGGRGGGVGGRGGRGGGGGRGGRGGGRGGRGGGGDEGF